MLQFLTGFLGRKDRLLGKNRRPPPNWRSVCACPRRDLFGVFGGAPGAVGAGVVLKNT